MGQVAVDKVPGYKPLILEMRSAPVLVNLGGTDTATPPSWWSVYQALLYTRCKQGGLGLDCLNNAFAVKNELTLKLIL